MSTFRVGVHIICTHADRYYANIICKLHTLMHDALCIRTFNTKARWHQQWSNVGSTEPSSSLNGDLHWVPVTFRCTNLNLVQLTIDQLIRGFEPWL